MTEQMPKTSDNLQEPNIISAAPLEHGRKQESTAIKAHWKKTDKISRPVVVVCTERLYLACSPGGIIDEATIVEVKCNC